MAQKVIQVGSSAGITIPPAILNSMRVRLGDTIDLVPQPESDSITINIVRKTKKTVVNKDLIAWAEDAIARYRPALEALRDK